MRGIAASYGNRPGIHCVWGGGPRLHVAGEHAWLVALGASIGLAMGRPEQRSRVV